MEGFIGRGRVGKQIISKRKERIISGLVIFWGKGSGRGLITCVTSLVLIRKFQICLKVTFLGKVEMAMKSWFTLLGLNDSILNLQIFFVVFFFSMRKRISIAQTTQFVVLCYDSPSSFMYTPKKNTSYVPGPNSSVCVCVCVCVCTRAHMCAHFFLPTSNAQTLDITSDSTSKGLSPTRLPSTSDTSPKSSLLPVFLTCTFHQPPINQRLLGPLWV